MFGAMRAQSRARKFKLEFNMLARMRPASIAIAVMLGIALNVHLAIPAFADSAPSKAAMQSRTGSPLHNGDLVRVRSGGPLMTVTDVQGDQVNCSWTDWNGELKCPPRSRRRSHFSLSERCSRSSNVPRRYSSIVSASVTVVGADVRSSVNAAFG